MLTDALPLTDTSGKVQDLERLQKVRGDMAAYPNVIKDIDVQIAKLKMEIYRK